jgi:thiol-disulfide isomerase/thioredoxin
LPKLFADAATSPSTQPATANDLIADIQAADSEFSALMGGDQNLFNADHRAAIAPKAIPLLQRMDSDFVQVVALQPMSDDAVEQQRVPIRAMLVIFGDAQTESALKKSAALDNYAAAPAASALFLADWWRGHSDPAAQQKTFDAFKPVAQKYSDDFAITTAALAMLNDAATPDLESQVRALIINDLKSTEAQGMAPQLVEDGNLQSLVGKPATIVGTTLDGKPFTTADWKGKVIVVNFWATWCPTCIDELPNLAKTYSEYHAKGLEVIGIDNDYSADTVKNFLAQHPESAWPQLFDPAAAAQQGVHPITLSYHIQFIGRMFLIDKAGNIRSVAAEEHLEELIPKLLAE